jgi:hypothetical protein
MRIPNLPAPEPSVYIDERRKLILAEVPFRGCTATTLATL